MAASDAPSLGSPPRPTWAAYSRADDQAAGTDDGEDEAPHASGRSKNAMAAAASGTGTVTGVRRDIPTHHVLKKEDGEMCTRADIQHDLLDAIFQDETRAFTAPDLRNPIMRPPWSAQEQQQRQAGPSTAESSGWSSTAPGETNVPFVRPGSKLTFSELYAHAIASSPRTTRQLKEALLDLEPGALPGKNGAKGPKRSGKDEPEDVAGEAEGEAESYEGLKDGFLRLCLLVNIGRINTTYAFYPEMRTILRAYHAVPSLQQTPMARKAMQDAPRMKNSIKAVKTVAEAESEDSKTLTPSLADLYALQDRGMRPTTSSPTAILALSLTLDPLPGTGLDLLQCFGPCNIPSAARARAFLYTLFHYLESRHEPNPWADAAGGLPPVVPLTDEEYAALGENIDKEEELVWGAEMRQRRIKFLGSLPQGGAELVEDGGVDEGAVPAVGASSSRRGRGPGKKTLAIKEGTPVGSDAGGRRRKKVPASVAALPPPIDTSLVADDEAIPRPPISPVTDARRSRLPAWVQEGNLDLDGVDYYMLRQLVDRVDREMGPPPPPVPEPRWSDFWPPPPPSSTSAPAPPAEKRAHSISALLN